MADSSADSRDNHNETPVIAVAPTAKTATMPTTILVRNPNVIQPATASNLAIRNNCVMFT